MSQFLLTLPLPPSVNRLYTGIGKNTRMTAKCRAWYDEAGWRINEARAQSQYKPLPAETWYWTDLRLPQNHLGDCDNRVKAVNDLLHKLGATPDDRWLLGGTYMRCADVDAGTCQVTARAVPNGVSGHKGELEQIAIGLGINTEQIEHRGIVT